jgi:hypothetical protein
LKTSINRFVIAAAAGLCAVCYAPNAHADDSVQLATASESDLLGPNVKDEGVASSAPAAAGPNTGRLHLSAGVDFTNAYFFRGIRQEDENFLVQPWATVTADAWKGDTWNAAVSLGTWNSFHDSGTGTVNDDLSDKWYESDIIAGATLSDGTWTFGFTYNWFLSPSDAWATIQQVDFSAAYADKGWLGENWTLNPSIVISKEIDNAADGQDEGWYGQLGVNPTTSFKAGETDVGLSFPVTLGMSLSDYYQNASGDDEFFGFASVGAKASIPLPVNADFGAWTLSASANVLFLGDSTKTFNEDDSTELVGTIGIGVTY